MLDTAQFVIVYLLTTLTFFAVDMVWLGVVAKKLYRDKLGELMRTKVSWLPAIVFYLAYIFGIIFFAVLPGLEADSLAMVLMNGALFGLLAYGTYDLTNLSTLKNWSKSITLIDMAWGTALTTFVAYVSYSIALWAR